MIDLKKYKINLLDDLENYDISFVPDGMLAVKDKKDIYVLEMNGNRLMQYSLDEKKCKYFEIKCNRRKWDNFAMISKYKKDVYIFPRYLREIVKVDIESGLVKKESCLKIDVQCSCQIKNVIWLFPEKGNSVIVHNMEDDTWREYKLPVEIDNCVHVIFYNRKFYILGSEGRILLWDMIDGSMEELCDCSKIEETPENYSRIAVTSRTIFLLPSLGRDIFKIDIPTKNIERYEAYPKGFQYCEVEHCSKYYGYCESERFYFFAMRSANHILSIDKYNGQEKWIKCQSPLAEKYMIAYAKYKGMTFYESEIDRSELEFLDKVINQKRIDKEDNTVGRAIWEPMKRE